MARPVLGVSPTLARSVIVRLRPLAALVVALAALCTTLGPLALVVLVARLIEAAAR